MSPEEVMARCCPIPGMAIFAIGMTEDGGVTVASQQRRAINLIDALLKGGRICAGARIAIIGGGAAGLTAAVRAASAGCRAMVIESSSELLATFRGNDTRLLHPNLYSWPAPGWLDPSAGLPIMMWSAGTAERVAAVLEEHFRTASRETGLIETALSATVEWTWPPNKRGPLLELTWKVGADRCTDAFSAVILAVGFGREPRTAPDTAFPGYWDPDHLGRGSEKSKKCLIVGAGDGGLTDTLRIRLNHFDQSETFRRLLDRPEAAGLATRIAELERSADAATMDREYRELRVAWLDDALQELGFRPHQVTLVDPGPTFRPGRFPLNKLLVSRLLRMGEVRIVPTRLTVPDPGVHGRLPALDLGSGPEHFDLALIRVGKGNAIGAFGNAITDGCARMVKSGRDIVGEPCQPSGPPGHSLEALVATLHRSPHIADLVESLLLYLRHAGRDAEELAEQGEFGSLRYELSRRLEAKGTFTLAAASGVVQSISEWLVDVPPSAPPDVVIRALVEALDYHCGERLHRALRGMAGRHVAREVAANRLCARGKGHRDPRGRRVQGLAKVMLTPGGSVKVHVEWTRSAWPTPVRVAVGRVLESIDDLRLTPLDGHPSRFFGARATSPSDHAARLSSLARDLGAHRAVDFVVLPEFALHDDPNWAKVVAGTGIHVVAGIGHVPGDRNRQHHQWIAALDDATPGTVTLKSAPSRYEQGGTSWFEDIHHGPPCALIALSADGEQHALLVAEDLHAWPASWLESLRPNIVLAVGGPLDARLIDRVNALTVEGTHCIIVGIGKVLDRPGAGRHVDLLRI